MNRTYLWTKSKARLQFVYANPSENYNWLFLPGGPGLGSESLNGLAEMLQLPGNVWHVDFPGDGSNTTENDTEYFAHWSQALIEAVSALSNVILVAHSSGGMFALATPALEDILAGLVLMDSAPDASWQKFFTRYVKENPVTEAEKLQVLYDENPSNETLKKLTIACAPYFSTHISLRPTVLLLESLPFNYQTHLWAAKNFDQTYQAKWIPKTFPTLIFAGDQDHITPLKLFIESGNFKRDNILIREIKNGSHFPWLDNPMEVKKVFEEFCQKLIESWG
jgi:pimeloyl-ACP methyl ester carboxylesterase